MRNSLKLVPILVCLSIVACTRAGKSNTATISFQIPNASHILGAIPAGQLTCFAANVNDGQALNSGNSGCLPTFGTYHSNFSSSGALTIPNIPRGDTVYIDLYMYLGAIGETSCPDFSTTGLTPQVLSKTYLVATGNETISPPQGSDSVDFPMTASFPGVAQFYTSTLGPSCQYTPPLPPITQVPTPYSVTGGGDHVVATGTYQMRAHVAPAYSRSAIAGGAYKVTPR
jgi:hypothetical protein